MPPRGFLLFFSLAALLPVKAQEAPRLSLDRAGRISWTAHYGVTYQLQTTPRLESPAWANIGAATAGQGGRMITVTNPIPNTGQAFYRVVATNAFACANTGGTNCATAFFLGSFRADVQSGFGCPDASCAIAAQRSGCGSAWFSIRLIEDSSCPAQLGIKVELQSPPGVDYDLYLYRGCDTLVRSSTRGPGVLDSVLYFVNDLPSMQDDTDMWIEVRYVGGTQPGSWTMTARTRNCN
jgi:hypothetical protein